MTGAPRARGAAIACLSMTLLGGCGPARDPDPGPTPGASSSATPTPASRGAPVTPGAGTKAPGLDCRFGTIGVISDYDPDAPAGPGFTADAEPAMRAALDGSGGDLGRAVARVVRFESWSPRPREITFVGATADGERTIAVGVSQSRATGLWHGYRTERCAPAPG